MHYIILILFLYFSMTIILWKCMESTLLGNLQLKKKGFIATVAQLKSNVMEILFWFYNFTFYKTITDDRVSRRNNIVKLRI